MLGWLEFSPDAHIEKPNQEWQAGITTLVHDLSDRQCLDPEFLQELTCHRVNLRLALLHLPPGKLPQAPVTLMVGPPGPREQSLSLRMIAATTRISVMPPEAC